MWVLLCSCKGECNTRESHVAREEGNPAWYQWGPDPLWRECKIQSRIYFVMLSLGLEDILPNLGLSKPLRLREALKGNCKIYLVQFPRLSVPLRWFFPWEGKICLWVKMQIGRKSPKFTGNLTDLPKREQMIYHIRNTYHLNIHQKDYIVPNHIFPITISCVSHMPHRLISKWPVSRPWQLGRLVLSHTTNPVKGAAFIFMNGTSFR